MSLHEVTRADVPVPEDLSCSSLETSAEMVNHVLKCDINSGSKAA